MPSLVDLAGSVFSRWLVLSRSGTTRPGGATRWLCRCLCGQVQTVLGSSLSAGTSTGCVRCKKHGRYLHAPKHDLTGRRFGLLLVATPILQKRGARQRWCWNCRCDCGQERVIDSSSLLNGVSTSCGCKRLRKGSDSPRWGGHGTVSGHYWNQVCNGAAKRGLRVGVSLRYAARLLEKQGHRCALSGREIKFDYGRGGKGNTTASLDRIDSRKGYVSGNLQWVHKRVNGMKMDFSDEEFISMCVDVANIYSSKQRAEMSTKDSKTGTV